MDEFGKFFLIEFQKLIVFKLLIANSHFVSRRIKIRPPNLWI